MSVSNDLSVTRLQAQDVIVNRPVQVLGAPAMQPATSGLPNPTSLADATATNTNTYITSIYVPQNTLVTGVNLLNGSGGGAGDIRVYITDSSGVQIAASTSTAQGALNTFQAHALATPTTLAGGRTYLVCAQFSNSSATYRTWSFGSQLTRVQGSSTYGTLPTVVIPTAFVQAAALVVALY